MEVVFIELGLYSIKFLRGVAERRTVRYLNFEQSILELPETAEPGALETARDLALVETAQFALIAKYLDQHRRVERVIINLPCYYSTLRLISLPVKSKKKIEQMIPFQLEEELPYPLAETHLAIHSMTTETGSYSIALATHAKQFDRFYQRCQSLPRSPNVVIGDEVTYQALISAYVNDDNIAIIDLGHSKSRCYLFHRQRLMGAETSFVCGQMINEVIAETYQISIQEAIEFKHKNAFFLIDDQVANADQAQQSFSLLMERVFSNLIDDFKRWSISYQLKTRQNVQKIFITGGTSNIKNIENFLTENIGIPTSHFDYLKRTPVAKLNLASPVLHSLTSCYGLSYHVTSRKGLSNFLSGDYAAANEGELPLKSIAFIGTRVTLACLLLLAVLIFERIHLNQANKKITKEITKELKNPVFAITPSQRRKLIRQPQELLASIRKKSQRIESQILHPR